MTHLDRAASTRSRRIEQVQQVERWLAAGGTVLAANERAARALVAAFDAARRAEGLTAWVAPAIFAWETWVRERWQERNNGGLVLLNPLQEQALWRLVLRASRIEFHGDGLAAAAQRAHRLLCEFAPGSLPPVRRMGWQGDAEIFSGWLTEFQLRCRKEGVVPASLMPLELTRQLIEEASPRAPLLLAGFDRLPNSLRALLDAWGEWKHEEAGAEASSASFAAAADSRSEIAACMEWLRQSLEANPATRLMILAPGLQQRRGELERALLAEAQTAPLEFEFSLGIPLSQIGLARCAVLLLRWLHEPLREFEVDWLIGCGHLAATREEEIASAEAMREIRERGQERPAWELEELLQPLRASSSHDAGDWSSRLIAALERLRSLPMRQSPLDWAQVAEDLLEIAGWPGYRPESSTQFQARARWQRVLEDVASLGFNGAQVDWAEFVSTLASAASTTIFATESPGAPILITEPFESAGQVADGIWFLGADEESWPVRGLPNALLPISLQRESGMPYASHPVDWEVAREATQRLLRSADQVVLSYARQSAEGEVRPSRLALLLLGPAKHLPRISESNRVEHSGEALTESFADWSRVPFPHRTLRSGAKILARQSLCPFQAFATARLAALTWQPAEAGLSARQRGQLLHAVLHRVWGGASRGGMSSLQELIAVADLDEFLQPIVQTVMDKAFGSDAGTSGWAQRRFPKAYLDLEFNRLVRLVSEWLDYERGRLAFRVTGTEQEREISIAGLRMNVRLDRVDLLEDGSQLIVDYKSGIVGPSAWAGERPDDAQLPMYAAFACEGKVGGVVFARVRSGDSGFHGRVRDAQRTLFPDLTGASSIVKHPLDDSQLDAWRQGIERLGREFLAGDAAVDPKDPVKTCRNCHLHAVCRILEDQLFAPEDNGDEDLGEGDE